MPRAHSRNFDVIVIAASLGGFDVIREILQGLPVDFPVPIVIAHHAGALPTLLRRHIAIRIKYAEHNEPLRAGQVYVAPHNRHLMITRARRCALNDTARVNFSRPAADPLFMSAAKVYGDRTLAVVLTGRLNDGSAGALAVRRAGGVVLVQDPVTCRAPGMPESTIRLRAPHCSLPTSALAAAFVSLAMVPGATALFGFTTRSANN